MTCAKTQGFLAKHKVSVTEQTDAKKATIKGAAALGVLDGVDELYVAKGKKVEHVDLKKAKPDRAALLAIAAGADGEPARAHVAEGAHADRRVRGRDLQEPAGGRWQPTTPHPALSPEGRGWRVRAYGSRSSGPVVRRASRSRWASAAEASG